MSCNADYISFPLGSLGPLYFISKWCKISENGVKGQKSRVYTGEEREILKEGKAIQLYFDIVPAP